ncbi:hypothetical protein [Anaerosinus sp.]|uniref:hypothetical protein n=1 Tax=Selenobaculum sp. TaxID=3074374 RepID=UPI003AB231E6
MAADMEGYSKLTNYEKSIIKIFEKEFAIENGTNIIAIAVKREKGYLRVNISDGGWLHVTPYTWY